MRKLIGLFAFLLIWSVQIGFAQTREITGTVVDRTDNSPLPGVSIVLKNTPTVGTATDNNGRFTLRVSSSDILVVSSIGMQTQEVVVGNRNNITIELVPTSETLQEFIVVGYGTVRREAKTGSVASVSGDELAEIPAISFDKMLAGRMTGVSVTSSTGQPGANSNIRIRGTSSINSGNEPLYVIDGIPIMSGDQSYFTNTSNAMAAINPSDIESVTVLKDAAAASIYGSRAANGVILITTKSGREGRNIFTARAKYGISWLANDNNFGMMSGEELVDFQRAAAINGGYNPDDPTSVYYRPYELLSRPQTNWMKHLTRMGKTQEYEITAQGGNNRTKIYSSLSFHKTEGIYYGFDYTRVQARINADHQLSDRLNMGVRMNVAHTKSNDVNTQELYYTNPAFAGLTIYPWTPPYNEDGSHNVQISENSNSNPRATALYDDQWEKQYRFNGNIFLEWKPVKGLTLRTTEAAEMTFGEGRRYWSPPASASGNTSTLQSSTLQYRLLTTSNTATYENEVFDHSFRVLVGQEAVKRDFHYYYIYSPEVDPDIPYPNTSPAASDYGRYSENTWTLMSIFGIFDYNYASRYFLQASLRYDGSSLFGTNNQWGLFYSVGASWNIHNEKFAEDLSWMDMLKLRLSYGENGNNNITPYSQFGLYSAAQYNGATGMRPTSAANDNLSWERNAAFNVGIDFSFLRRFTANIDYYTRKTTDLLLSKPLSYTTGFPSSLQNVGSIRNSGVEFMLEANVIDRGEWRWDLGFNISHNKSKILKLVDDEMITFTDPVTASTVTQIKHIPGEKLTSFYVRDYYGVNPLNGEALWRTEDGRISNDISDAAYIIAGSPEPSYTGGFFTNLSWKGLALNAQFEFKGGNKVLLPEHSILIADGAQMSVNQTKSARKYWKNPGDTGVNPKPVAGNTTNANTSLSTRFLEKGDYLRIKDITLSYTLPDHISKKAKLTSTKIYISGLNLYTFHDVNFWDPERGISGTGLGVYPMTKTFVGGIEISF